MEVSRASPDAAELHAGKKATLVNFTTYDADLENREVRNWWKKRNVHEADAVVEGGYMLGGFVENIHTNRMCVRSASDTRVRARR
jgi:hypothetical protein